MQSPVTVTAATPSAALVGALEGTATKPDASATLEQCITAGTATERAATFAGEMNAIAGTARMEIRIDVLERLPGELSYRAVSAPGLGVWTSSSPGVKIYKSLNKVTNLAAPAFYRGAVRFRWLNAKGRVLKMLELRTRRCEQPTSEAPETETSPPSTGQASPSS
jgi:hypothetical protein